VRLCKWHSVFLSASAVGMSGKAFDDVDDFVAAEAVVAGEFEEIACAGEHCPALGGARDGDAAPAAELQQAFVSEDVQCRRTVFLFTPRTAARSFARGRRSPGLASPSAMARRIRAAT